MLGVAWVGALLGWGRGRPLGLAPPLPGWGPPWASLGSVLPCWGSPLGFSGGGALPPLGSAFVLAPGPWGLGSRLVHDDDDVLVALVAQALLVVFS